MGDILEFPSQQAQGLAYLDREIRQLLQTRGADQELIDFAADQLTGFYSQISESEQYQFSIRLPAGLQESAKTQLEQQVTAGLEGIRAENHALMIKLVAQLVLAEVRLYELQRE